MMLEGAWMHNICGHICGHVGQALFNSKDGLGHGGIHVLD